jgi:hypothetical protein
LSALLGRFAPIDVIGHGEGCFLRVGTRYATPLQPIVCESPSCHDVKSTSRSTVAAPPRPRLRRTCGGTTAHRPSLPRHGTRTSSAALPLRPQSLAGRSARSSTCPRSRPPSGSPSRHPRPRVCGRQRRPHRLGPLTRPRPPEVDAARRRGTRSPAPAAAGRRRSNPSRDAVAARLRPLRTPSRHEGVWGRHLPRSRSRCAAAPRRRLRPPNPFKALRPQREGLSRLVLPHLALPHLVWRRLA